MKHSPSRRTALASLARGTLGLAAVSAGIGAAQAADAYPSKPIRWIVPYAAGGGVDIQARLVSKYWSPLLGTDFIIDNKPGGQTIIGSAALVKSPADGYTVMSIVDNFPLLPLMFKKMPFNIETDFEFLSTMSRVPMFLVVRSNSPIKTFADAVTAMKKDGLKLNYGSYGLGSTPHLSMEAFSARVGTTLTHVPYQGAAATMNAMIGGDLDLSFENIVTSVPFIKDGRLRVLAISTKERHKFFPDVPTIHEQGFQGFDFYSWQGLVGPKGLPPAVVEKLTSTLHKAMANEELRNDFGGRGWDVSVGSPAEFRKHIETSGASIKAFLESRKLSIAVDA